MRHPPIFSWTFAWTRGLGVLIGVLIYAVFGFIGLLILCVIVVTAVAVIDRWDRYGWPSFKRSSRRN